MVDDNHSLLRLLSIRLNSIRLYGDGGGECRVGADALTAAAAAPHYYRPEDERHGQHDAVQSGTHSQSLTAGADSDRAGNGNHDGKM
jgi:hypothetical protein